MKHLENMQNQSVRSKNKTGFKNIHYNPKNKLYRVDIVFKGNRYSSKGFKTIEEAKIELDKIKKSFILQ